MISSTNTQGMDLLKSTWKNLESTTLQLGALDNQNSNLAVKALATKIGIQVTDPSWTSSLLELLKQAALSQDVSIQVAAAGIARSFSILGAWGAFISTDTAEKEFCLQARKVSEVYLRSLTRNFFIQFADFLRQHLSLLLIKRSILPAQCQDAYRRRSFLAARPEEGFDAVISFADAGIWGELDTISQKLTEKKITWWESLLINIERFLSDVIPASLSPQEDVARLHMQWRLLTREIDLLLNDIGFEDSENKKLKNYVWQFNWIKRVLLKHLEQHHWNRQDEEIPYFHIKRYLGDRTVSDIVKKLQTRLTEASLIQQNDPIFVLEITS